MAYSFLLVGKQTDTLWPLVLQWALSSLGKLRTVLEEEALRVASEGSYDVIVVDSLAVRNVVLLVSRLHAQCPRSRIIVATASPTWQRAREALKAGAADYIRKSLDKEELRSKIEAVLELPPPPPPT